VNSLLSAIMMSACLGALVGLIRQWSDQVSRPAEADFGGVRTYTFWAMLGCLGAAGSEKLGLALLAVVLALVGAQQIVAMAKMPPTSHPGGTTFASVMLTMFTGALVFWGQRQAALLVAATTMVIVGMKQTLHAWTRTFTTEDISGTLQFVAITGVILPLVPNQAYGPFGAFNPYSTWLMVVLISGLGFVGYIMMRMLGAKAGTTITGLVGGVASSTATTLAFSRRSKDDPALSASYTPRRGAGLHGHAPPHFSGRECAQPRPGAVAAAAVWTDGGAGTLLHWRGCGFAAVQRKTPSPRRPCTILSA
jgi:hypothetical protein